MSNLISFFVEAINGWADSVVNYWQLWSVIFAVSFIIALLWPTSQEPPQ